MPQRVLFAPRLRRRRAVPRPAKPFASQIPTPARSSGQPPRCVPPAIGSGSKAAGSAEGGSLSLFGNKMAGDGRTMVFLYTVWIHPLKKSSHNLLSKRRAPGFCPFCHYPGRFRTLYPSYHGLRNLPITFKSHAKGSPSPCRSTPQQRLNVQDSPAILQTQCGYNHPLTRTHAHTHAHA